MAKVSSESTGPKLKKPILTSPPLTAYAPEYLQRKAEVGEKLFQLKNGRQLCYFTEGDVKDPAVLCLPALGESKCAQNRSAAKKPRRSRPRWMYVFPKPLPGIYLIAVDRIGHGRSSPIKPKEQWSAQCAEVTLLNTRKNKKKRRGKNQCAEVLELLDSLGVGKFLVTGISCGGVHTMMMAAAYLGA